jgi:hypothetical protein
MGIVNEIRQSIAGTLDRRNQEREEFDRMQKEIAFQRKQAAMEQLKEKNLHASIDYAKKSYRQSSGFNKLRAVNREINIRHPEDNPNGYLGKLSQYTQNNIAIRERNLEKTRRLREEARRLREDRMSKRIQERQLRLMRNQYK